MTRIFPSSGFCGWEMATKFKFSFEARWVWPTKRLGNVAWFQHEGNPRSKRLKSSNHRLGHTLPGSKSSSGSWSVLTVSLIRPRSSFIGGSIPEWVLWVWGMCGAGSSGMGTSSASRSVDTTAWWNSNKSSPKKESFKDCFLCVRGRNGKYIEC